MPMRTLPLFQSRTVRLARLVSTLPLNSRLSALRHLALPRHLRTLPVTTFLRPFPLPIHSPIYHCHYPIYH